GPGRVVRTRTGTPLWRPGTGEGNMVSRPGMAKVRACLAGLLLMLATMVQAEAGEQHSAYWAGFAFTGEASARAEAVPYSSATLDAGTTEALNAKLLAALRRQVPANIRLIDD